MFKPKLASLDDLVLGLSTELEIVHGAAKQAHNEDARNCK
jgi:hypothetical protein